jgi:hypothetical protein
MLRFTVSSMLWSFVLFFTTFQFSNGAIEQDDVVMAFTFAAGDNKLGKVAEGILKDVSGKGHDGIFQQKPKWADGVWGAGLQVSPAGGRWNAATVPHKNDMDLKEFAIAAWVKVEKLLGDCCNMIVSKENWDADRTRNYSMWMRNEVIVGFTTRNPFNDVEARSILVTDGEWHHAVGTYDGRDLTQYVDGVAHGRAPFGGQDPVFHPTERLHIGAMGPGGNRLGIEGFVDEVAIFNRGLTEREVKSLMDRGIEKLLGFQAVNPKDKMATTWARLKSPEY